LISSKIFFDNKTLFTLIVLCKEITKYLITIIWILHNRIFDLHNEKSSKSSFLPIDKKKSHPKSLITPRKSKMCFSKKVSMARVQQKLRNLANASLKLTLQMQGCA